MVTHSKKGGLTKHQQELVEQFLHLYAEVENGLKTRLGLRPDDRAGIGQLVSRYVEVNPHWSDSARQLWELGEIRNVLTHHRNTENGFPVAVTRRAVSGLEAIRHHLLEPEPVSRWFRKSVRTVSGDDTLASVVVLSFQNGFSQFPVIGNERFIGLITENEITRWLGRRTMISGAEVDLTTVSVRNVLREKEPDREKTPIFRFARMDAPTGDVLGLFSVHPTLEVVLLTQNGSAKSPIEGIITQWDAARFPKT